MLKLYPKDSFRDIITKETTPIPECGKLPGDDHLGDTQKGRSK
jgi:hypothetical protein